MKKQVVVVVGAGLIGQAIARRVGSGCHILLADLRQENADRAAETMRDAGFEVATTVVDAGDRTSIAALVQQATALGEVRHLVQAAGVSPSQAPIEAILKVDLLGTAVLLELFGAVIADGGSGVVIASQSGHRLPALAPEEDRALATTPADELLALDFLAEGRVKDTLHAYQLSKRANALRVSAEAVRWGLRGARLNCVSPGIVMTPLARDELGGPRGAGYREMLEKSPAGRAGTPDEIGALAAFVMGPDGAFITGSDLLIDGGTTAAFKFGGLRPE